MAMFVSLISASSPRKARAQARGDTTRDVVVTGTRTPESAQRATVKTETVTGEEAIRRGATNVGEALSSQPGVQVNPGAYGYLGNVSAIQIQGFDRDRVLVLEDGERVVGDVGGAIDLANIPTGDIDRIEIVTGPTSSLYGASAIGGVVNILTGPPRLEGPSGRARLEGRSYRGLVLQGNGAYRKGATWAGLDLNYTRQDGMVATEGLPDLRIPESNRRMLGIRAGTSIAKGIDVRVRGRWLRDRLDGVESTVTPGLGRYIVDLPEETNRYTLHVIETMQLGGGSSLRFTLGRQWIDGVSAKDRRNSPLDEVRERHHRMHSAEGVATIADGPRTWVAGARFEAESFGQELTKSESSSQGIVTTHLPEVDSQSLASGAAYAQLRWRLGDWLTLLPGVRGELHTRYGSAVTPRLALSSRVSKTVQVRASGGRGFRGPSAKELGFIFDHSIYGYRVDGNPSLSPETSWGINGDVGWQDGRAQIRASGFANWVDDLIEIDLSAGKATGGVTSYTYKNFGAARTMGAQLDAGYRIGDRFHAEASYAYLYTRDDVNRRPLGGRPPHTVTTSLRGTAFWNIQGYLRWRVVTDAFVDETTRSPGYSSIDLRVSRPIWPRSEAYVGVLNLVDVHQEPGRIGDLRPPFGRVFYVGIRAEFPWEEEGCVPSCFV